MHYNKKNNIQAGVGLMSLIAVVAVAIFVYFVYSSVKNADKDGQSYVEKNINAVDEAENLKNILEDKNQLLDDEINY